ncbi:MAG: carbohydrate binding domain-containing protein, partial [Armatimonadetes bacterium]|nr:carbohydrate binding domain-containing protein [Armatimonadota bacterium]
MRRLLLLLLFPALCLAADAGLVNGDFSADADRDGVPDGWTTSGDQGVRQALRRETLPDGSACALLACTAFTQSSAASHCMLAQVGAVKLTQGQWYRLRFRVKGEAVAAGSVDMAISDTKTWSNCGLHDGVFLSPDWAWYETTFRATQTVSATSRLQFWFGSTGRVWFADMTLEPTTAPRRQYTERMPETTARNRVPNAGFECGEAGWGSVTDVPGWGGNLNRLVGRVVEAGAHSGGRCLEIAVSPRNLLTYWFDYFDLQQQPVRMPLAANRGWLGVEPERGYTLSAWVKADPPGQTVLLRAQHAGAGRADLRVKAGGAWSRVSMPFRARGDQCYVAVGPDLAADQRDTATLWVDDVMLEAGDTAGVFEPRGSVEVGVRVPRDGGLFAPGEPVQVAATAANHTDAARRVALHWVTTDFHDKEVDRGEQTVALAAHAEREVTLPVRASRRGFYRVVVTADGAEVTPPLPLRLAVIPTNQRADTLVGMNHGY